MYHFFDISVKLRIFNIAILTFYFLVTFSLFWASKAQLLGIENPKIDSPPIAHLLYVAEKTHKVKWTRKMLVKKFVYVEGILRRRGNPHEGNTHPRYPCEITSNDVKEESCNDLGND
jgi:hypothetical protein